MKILITGASSRLAGGIATELSDSHDLRLMDSVPVDVKQGCHFMQGSILDPDDSCRAVGGMDALIHTSEPPTNLPTDGVQREQMILDLATRGTHTIFRAAIDAGIKRFIYAGTLSIFSAYPDDVYISELWKPLPSPEIVEITKYLGELTCREFVRDSMIAVTSLRLGELVYEEEVQEKTPNLMWLDIRDAAQAFRCALHRNSSHEVWWTKRWAMYHICADIPNPRFLINQAQQIGYQPVHNFQTHYSAFANR